MLFLYLESPRKALLLSEMLAEETCDTVGLWISAANLNRGLIMCALAKFHAQPRRSKLPSKCRQIFVTERCSNDTVTRPSDRGAAMIMGHSTRQWLDWYGVKFHARLALHAVDAMTLERNAMLQDAASEQLNSITKAAITATTARCNGRCCSHASCARACNSYSNHTHNRCCCHSHHSMH